LKKVGLFARQRDPVGGFSRGMVQRLTIARATLHEPDVLLLDEPYTGLDQDAAGLLDTLLRHESELGRTILLITHDLAHGLQQSDRIAVLNRGRIATVQKSANTTAAEFLELYANHTRTNERNQRSPGPGAQT
jgi:heme exporter protein A